MSDPSDKAERLCAMFHSYCKAVMRNASRVLNESLGTYQAMGK